MDNKFIVVEGLDGVGKTTCVKMLAEMMNGCYYKTPSSIFQQMRGEVDSNNDLVTRFLFYLSAVSSASTEIKKLLEKKDVLCDRFIRSTIAFHRAMKVDMSFINFYKLPLLSPDFTFYLWAREDVIKQRIGDRSLSLQWWEKDRKLQKRIEEELLSFPAHVIDTSDCTPEQVCKKILTITG